MKFLAHNPSFFYSLLKLICTSLCILFFIMPLAKSENPTRQGTALFLKKEVPQLRNTIDLNNGNQKKAFEEKMDQAAALYEKQFLREMVSAMRATIQHSEISQPTMAEKIYKDKLYEEYVEKWSQRGGVGFRDIIYQQLLEKYSPFHRPQNPRVSGAFPLQAPTEVLELIKEGKNMPRLKQED